MKWHNIKKKKPKDGQEVIIWTQNISDYECSRIQRASYSEFRNGDGFFTVYPIVWKELYKSKDNYIGNDLEGDKIQITHWMNIPSPPTSYNSGYMVRKAKALLSQITKATSYICKRCTTLETRRNNGKKRNFYM
jgi:hypothetical protein